MDLALIVLVYILAFVVGLSILYLIIKNAVKNGVKAAFSDMNLIPPEQDEETE